MPAPTRRPTGAPCWVDLSTSDAERASAFYSELFGWTVTVGGEEYGGYRTFRLDGRDAAGCMGKQPGDDDPDAWSVYLLSNDLAGTVAAARSHGGEVRVEPMEIPGTGWMAVLTDPGGADVAVWQPGEFAGFEAVDEPGAASWFELHSRSYATDVAFYHDVFGWDTHVMSDTPTFRYTTLGAAPNAAAGILDVAGARGETPPEWMVYFRTGDCTATCARATELGGSVVDPPQDSSYGRVATVADPTGAVFKVIGPPAA